MMQEPSMVVGRISQLTEAPGGVLPRSTLRVRMPHGAGVPWGSLGYCPTCGAPGRQREKRPDGNDRCEAGHWYPSRDALPTPPGRALPDVGCRYEHVETGRRYIVTGVKLGTEDGAGYVVYDPLYPVDLPVGHTGFVRPLAMFMDGRFRRIRG